MPYGILIYPGVLLGGIHREISVPTEFPLAGQVRESDTYYITVDVTDNNPLHTNTGQSFTAGTIVVWHNGQWWPTSGGTSGVYIPYSEKGAPNGVATLDANGLIPDTQLTHVQFSAKILLSAEPLSQYNAVKYYLNDTVLLCDGTDPLDFDQGYGIAAAAVGAAQPVMIYKQDAEITDPGFSWTTGLPVFAGPGGVLTQDDSLPTAFWQQIAFALSPTVLKVDIKSGIRRVL